jgi:hypothetical protein
MSLLDDAFLLVKDAFDAAGHAEAQSRLHSKYPSVERHEIVESYRKAHKLAQACYAFGERCRAKDLTDEAAVREMRKRFPGFSEATYRAALSHGYFVSR